MSSTCHVPLPKRSPLGGKRSAIWEVSPFSVSVFTVPSSWRAGSPSDHDFVGSPIGRRSRSVRGPTRPCTPPRPAGTRARAAGREVADDRQDEAHDIVGLVAAGGRPGRTRRNAAAWSTAASAARNPIGASVASTPHATERSRTKTRGEIPSAVRACNVAFDPLVARIVCCCDAYSAITTDRPYRGRTLRRGSTRATPPLRRDAVRPGRGRRARTRALPASSEETASARD